LSATLAALADPTRRAIVARLARGDATVGELAEPFEMALPSVSRHLYVLESAGLIERRRDAQWRVCRLRPEPMRELAEWVEEYRTFWESTFRSLAEYVDGLQRGQRAVVKPPRPARGKRGLRRG
jgi:DNA-binding transcriptional ArsR family regulator